MKLTHENYFSSEAQLHFMSVSQFKDFEQCESQAMAKLKGEWQETKTMPLLIGGYIDAYFEGTMDSFKTENPEIFTQKGNLYADFYKADMLIERLEKDLLFMEYMAGKKQVIMTGDIDGIPVKIKIDSLHEDKIVDLKIMKDFAPMWVNGEKVTFIQAWGYDLQGAVYQAIEGNGKPFFIAGATKEKEPDIGLFGIPQEFLNERLNYFRGKAPRYVDIKKGLIEPTRCERCDYCKSTKVLSGVIDMTDLIYEME